MNFNNALLTMALTALGAATSYAGGYSGGGGDYHEMGTGTAWFLGSQEIRYCIEISPTFGASESELNQTIESAAATWRKYIDDRGIQSMQDPQAQLNLNLRHKGDCTGDEDLRFYFGSEPTEVTEAKKKFDRPYAFAYRESYDLQKRMGKGFIWFAEPGSLFPQAGNTGFPNWKKPYTLHGMLLHEFGHVMGVGHLDGTIMAESMMSWLQFMDSSDPASQSRGKAFLTNIDDTKILYFRSDIEIEFNGRLSYNNEPKEVASNFKLLTGRDPVGPVEVTFKSGAPMKLVLRDSKEVIELEMISPLAARSEFSLLRNIFGAYFEGQYPTVTMTGSTGLSGVGFLKTKNGKTLTIQYGINDDGWDGPVHLNLIDGVSSRKLFYSNINGSIL